MDFPTQYDLVLVLHMQAHGHDLPWHLTEPRHNNICFVFPFLLSGLYSLNTCEVYPIVFANVLASLLS